MDCGRNGEWEVVSLDVEFCDYRQRYDVLVGVGDSGRIRNVCLIKAAGERQKISTWHVRTTVYVSHIGPR